MMMAWTSIAEGMPGDCTQSAGMRDLRTSTYP